MKKKILTLFLAASMTAALLAGCGSGDNKAKGDTEKKSESAEKSTDEKTLVYGSGDYTNINPALYEHGEIDPHTESFSVFAYYFSQMIITALNYQEQVKEKRKKGANMSDKEKTLISHLLYFTGIVSNESVLVDYDYLKSLLKQYKDKDIRSLNAFYY